MLAPNAKLRSAIIPSAPVNATNTAEVHADAPHPSAPARISWARLLKRVFDIDIEQCFQCSGTLKIIAALVDPAVIAKILTHLGWSARHLRYAVPASLAVRPALPVLAFAPPSPGAHPPRSPARSFHPQGAQQGCLGPGQLRWRSGTRPWPWLSIDSNWPDPKPTPPPIRFISLSRPPSLALARPRRQTASTVSIMGR